LDWQRTGAGGTIRHSPAAITEFSIAEAFGDQQNMCIAIPVSAPRDHGGHAASHLKQALACLELGTIPKERGAKTMKMKPWMLAKGIVVAIFGVGFVLIPSFLASIYGMSLDAAGTLMARLFGAAFICESIVLFFAKGGAMTEKPVRGLVTGVVVSNAIGFIVTLLATLAGVWNMFGWLPVILYLVFGGAFAYFLFKK
jgi:hypothetical protein